MKAIVVMFDTLNRRYLAPYGCDWVKTPNFSRLAAHGVTFDNSYAGSLPCMPARRDMLTGRYNFLHRSWGPIEPYDETLPEMLRAAGVYTHLVTDHQHYWEDGGATYHNRYNSFEFVRGQEGDPWKAVLRIPKIGQQAAQVSSHLARQDLVNRSYSQEEENFPQALTFKHGIDFIRTNHLDDHWYLQIETADPHEPFRAPERFRNLYDQRVAPAFEWPPYGPALESAERVQAARIEYAALMSMCDAYLGKVLDVMDDLDLWKDTLLIVNTDHGFLLGEHQQWAKCVQPFYQEVVHTPLFIWDPRTRQNGKRRSSLVQLIDIAPTVLEYFDLAVSRVMRGHSLFATIKNDQAVRKMALFGMHGNHVNITDGRYVYMRGPQQADNQPLYNYTLMPTHVDRLFSVDELRQATLASPFDFSKGLSLLKVPGTGAIRCNHLDTLLFDVKNDPMQVSPYRDLDQERALATEMVGIMVDHDAPKEQYERLGLDGGEKP